MKPSHAKPETAPEPSPSRDEKIALAPELWLDPDVRWLCGVHQSDGHFYLIRERYEELLWWLLLPALLNLAGEENLAGQDARSRTAVKELSETVKAALASAEVAGYRVDALLGPVAGANNDDSPASEPESGHADKR
jgi:hypothetical protein